MLTAQSLLNCCLCSLSFVPLLCGPDITGTPCLSSKSVCCRGKALALALALHIVLEANTDHYILCMLGHIIRMEGQINWVKCEPDRDLCGRLETSYSQPASPPSGFLA